MTAHKKPRVKIDEKRARAIEQLKRGGATAREIAATIGVSLGAVSGYMKRTETETDLRVAAAEAPLPTSTDPSAGDATGSVSNDLAFLERELRELRGVAARTSDAIERSKISAKIGELTSKLARLRIADNKSKTPEKDATMQRAGHEAADRFRKLLDEALGSVAEAS